jgi:hypothetical protein
VRLVAGLDRLTQRREANFLPRLRFLLRWLRFRFFRRALFPLRATRFFVFRRAFFLAGFSGASKRAIRLEGIRRQTPAGLRNAPAPHCSERWGTQRPRLSRL